MMVVNSNGVVVWNPMVNMRAWCDAKDKGDWPKDMHECVFILAIWRDNENIILQYDVNKSQVVKFLVKRLI